MRRFGGGGKSLLVTDSTLLSDLEGLVEPRAPGIRIPLAMDLQERADAGDPPESRRSFDQSPGGVGAFGGSRLQPTGNRKAREGTEHPDRDEQFRYINRLVEEFQGNGQPVISVDTKKKELVGDFKNAGKQWRPKQTPDLVRVHDFLIPEKGKAIPYGVYDLTRNAGWVSVGIDHDTASFAARTILRWWRKMVRPVYPARRNC